MPKATPEKLAEILAAIIENGCESWGEACDAGDEEQEAFAEADTLAVTNGESSYVLILCYTGQQFRVTIAPVP